MKKRLCSLLLVLTMLSTLLVAPASALEADGSTSAGNETYVYLGVKDYGTVEADSKPDFVHRFYTNGEEVQYTIASSDNKYAVQNKLQEGYVYDLSTQGSVVTDANLAAAKAEGKIESATASSVTVGGKTYDIANVYEITNNTAGKATVTAKTAADLTAGATVKVYGDTAFLTFVAEDYTAPVSGTPGERTLKNYLQTAMNPVGTALYVYGGSWDWQDVNSSNQALTIGLPQSWIDFFQQQDANYTYKNSADPAHSYYPHNSWNQYYYAGVDCSAYIGWTVYNVMHTESTTNDLSDGYVMSAVKMAKTFAEKGWGTWTRDIKSFKPGDIFSMSGHVWTVLGVCDDGSIVFLHSTPSDSKAGQGGGGVQLSALNPNSDDDKNCEAYKLVTKYMTKYYPEWSDRYDAVLRSYISYATPATGTEYKETWSGNFSWNLDSSGLTDPDGYADMSAAEILADLFGDAETQPSQKGFNDVKPGDYFYDAVNWAVEKGITTGTSATTFSPNASCTRAQIVTFPWRASGSPEPKTASNPFTDVAANAYYCEAVLWAVENGITTGTSATTFSPDAPCTRAQGVTFLWRANGSKAASAAASFTDVASDAYYAPAVAWAAEQNVTGGVGNGLFSPDTTCTRAQIVSMLYRLR
ncbi:S-layer homology domain-containing protein [Oscillibacter valericigenes]|nr:S-layer homology domain-containing protein [Oscillibacter valericigenes]